MANFNDAIVRKMSLKEFAALSGVKKLELFRSSKGNLYVAEAPQTPLAFVAAKIKAPSEINPERVMIGEFREFDESGAPTGKTNFTLYNEGDGTREAEATLFSL